MDIQQTEIPDVKIVTPRRIGDDRGFFSEVYNRRTFAEAGLDLEFVQDNHSLSREAGTIRGLHFQSPPFAQCKLVRVTRGRILDVAVDLRRSSPTFGRHVAVELSASNWRQLLVPIGFAHGFCSLEPDTEVLYKVTSYYSAAHDHGVAVDDPALGIEWPVPISEAILSEKDRKLPRLAELSTYFDE
nr:dTDP-4-dehydrorhamnose 3,5-epimerase [Microvirga solisilvae]